MDVTDDLRPVATATVAAPATPATGWRYPDDGAGDRDLRIDFMRGAVMFLLVVVHFEVFSWFNFVAWERIGLVAGAEGFVILSGVVLGMVHRRTIEKHGFRTSCDRLLARAAQLYRVNLGIIVAVAVLALYPLLDASSVMTYTDRGGGKVYPLYPGEAASWPAILARFATLRAGPHQIQILGLYVVLLAVTPLLLWLFKEGRTRLVLAASWLLYFWYQASPAMPTGAQFEYAFPLLAWQVLFVHGLALGYHRAAVRAYFDGPAGRPLVALAAIGAAAFALLAWNNPTPLLPEWSRLAWVAPDTFRGWYGLYFQKTPLGLGRLANYACLLVTTYAVLTRWWVPLHRAFGWYFVPIGQATLYVFITHVFLILFAGQFVAYGVNHDHMLANTAFHAAVLLALWGLVRGQVLYRWIPR